MDNRLGRALTTAAIGAALGAVCVLIVYARSPGIVIDFDRPVPRSLATGFFPVERAPDGLTFAWTADVAAIRLRELDRRPAWNVCVRMRGSRPDPATVPEVSLAIDNDVVRTDRISNDFESWCSQIDTHPAASGLNLQLKVAQTFNPGPQDPRSLGVMVDEIVVTPASAGSVRPPRGVLTGVPAAGTIYGLAAGLLGLSRRRALVAVLLVTAGLAVVCTRAWGVFTSSPGGLAWLVVAITAPMAALSLLVERFTSAATHHAREAFALSAGALIVKSSVLLHPDMHVGDALFHAHRFQLVLASNYYFTSVAPGGYEFPYAIALYLTAAPLSGLVTGVEGLVVLLRLLVAAADTTAGLLVYAATTAATGIGSLGLLALALYHVIPLGFQVQATGNLTNGFGQSLFVALLAWIVITGGAGWRAGRIAVGVAITAWAMVAHMSTFSILTIVLVLLVTALARSPVVPHRRLARPLAIVLLVAFVVAVLGYYGHFAETYRALFARISGEMLRPVAESGGRSLALRLAFVPHALVAYLGVPNLLLGLSGIGLWLRRSELGLLGPVLGAWSAGCGLFLMLGILTPVDMRYYLAWFPALAILAAYGAFHAWAAGGFRRLAAGALLGWSVWNGVAAWLAPLA
jgi:hypothetical protein